MLCVDVGIPVRDAVTMVTVNPHRLLGSPEIDYALGPGCRADIVSFRVPPTEPAAIVDAVFVKGASL